MSINFLELENLALSDYERRGVETVKRIVARAEARKQEVADVPTRFTCSEPSICPGDQGFYLRRSSSVYYDVSNIGVVSERDDKYNESEGETPVSCVLCGRVAQDDMPGVNLIEGR